MKTLALITLILAAWIAFWEVVARCEIAVYALFDVLDERFDLSWW